GGCASTGWLARSSPLDAGWLALLIGSLIGLAVSSNPGAALGRFGAVLAALTLYFWLQSWARTPARFRLASACLVSACGVGALVVLGLIKGQLPASLLTRVLGPRSEEHTSELQSR